MNTQLRSVTGALGSLALLLLAACASSPQELADQLPESPQQAVVVHRAKEASPPPAAMPVHARVSAAHVDVEELHTPVAAANSPPHAEAKPERPLKRAKALAAPRSEQLTETPAPASAHQKAGLFEWPVEGKILSGFGVGKGAQRNDGINIAAETGTPIHAAADGTVSFAAPLKAYGNVILIKHDNGYLTAYAHASRILVSKGDRVARGDVIGFAGQTGNVSTPQLHFEVRKGVTPVDPTPLLMEPREG